MRRRRAPGDGATPGALTLSLSVCLSLSQPFLFCSPSPSLHPHRLRGDGGVRGAGLGGWGDHEEAVCAEGRGGAGLTTEDGGGPDRGSERVRGEEGRHAGMMEADAQVALGGPRLAWWPGGEGLVEAAL